MNFLITGGCGFIGSNFINYLLDTYPTSQIVNIDCLNYCSNVTNVKYQSGSGMYTLVHANLQDMGDGIRDILVKYKITHVIHFAAQSHVDTSFVDTGLFVRDNILATHVLLEECKGYKLDAFVYISTDEVYGDTTLSIQDDCKTEESAFYPTNPYAATKAAAEMLAKSYYYSFGLPVIITRSNNVYGENQYHEKLIPKFIKQIMNDEKCPIHGDGEYKRTWVHAYDFCRAIDCILNAGSKCIGQVYNIGTDDEYSVLEIVEKLASRIGGGTITNINEYITYVKDRVFNDKRYHISFEKLNALGWHQSIPFDVGLDRLIKSSEASVRSRV